MRRVTVAVSLGLIALLTLGLAACGSSSQPIAVRLTSSAGGTDQGRTLLITASVANDSKSAGVQWSVSGGGTLGGETTTSATYSAPPSVPSAFLATITATSITDATEIATLQIKVSPPPAITTSSLPAATAGAAYSAALAVSGGTIPFRWTITSGALPLGLILGSGTGLISGTATGAGSSSVTIKLTDAAGLSASQAVTITVNPPPPLAVTTTTLPQATIGIAYDQQLKASGGVPTYNWSVTAGSLPAGLTLSSAGVISGKLTGTASTSNFTVTVTDSQTPASATASANLSLTVVAPPLTVTTTSLPGGSVGTAYSQALQAIGGTPPYTWSISTGTLPTGLSLAPSTGAITGKPKATGTSNFKVTVTDSASATATSGSLSIIVSTDLAITPATLPGGSVSEAYSATILATGGAQPYTWTITGGSLPAGLTLTSSTEGGTISGTPTTTGISNFTVTVTDSESPAVKANINLSITIASANCTGNGSLNGNYAMVLKGWSSAPGASPQTTTAAIGSFVADGAGNISSGLLDENDTGTGPNSGTFTGKYCVASNNLATINLTYGGGLSGTNTFEAALNSNGSTNNIIFYDNSGRKATGTLRKQDTSAFSTSSITGNYAFGFVGVADGAGAPRFAMAGAFNANGTDLTGQFDSDTYLAGPTNSTLTSSNFSVASTGRGTATITFTGLNNFNFVFYVINSSELLAMEDDGVGSPLLAGQVLQQSGAFTDAALGGVSGNEVSVIETQSLNAGTTPSTTAGLVTTSGTGSSITFSEDENVGGTMSSPSLSGSYSVSTDGRVTMTLAGLSTPPVFYLIAPNQAYVVGTSPITVDFGLLEPQSGSNFNNSSLTGTYAGGSLQPVDSSVNQAVYTLQANGIGTLTGTSDQNGSGEPSTNAIDWTYTVSSDGRVVVQSGAGRVGIIYIISATQFVFLPTSTDPALVQFQQ